MKIITNYTLETPLQQLIDEEADIKAELQHARNMMNREAVVQWTKDLVYCQNLIRNHN